MHPTSLDEFSVLRRLGDGSFSEVYLARHLATDRLYALKVINKKLILRHKAVDGVRLERDLLLRLTDPGVVRLHFTFQSAESLYLALDHCPNGELFHQIRARGKLDLDTARHYAAEIVLTLGALQQAGVVHRDLKPENLLLDEGGHLKLVDFGSAKVLAKEGSGKGAEEEVVAGGLVGTADYVSPEVLESKAAGFSADLWALGCIVYQMLTGRSPFKAASEYLSFLKIAKAEYAALTADDAPSEAREFVAGLLRIDPGARLGATDLEELKAHPFFAGVDWEGLREGPAPPMVEAAEPEEEFDWELQSLREHQQQQKQAPTCL